MCLKSLFPRDIASVIYNIKAVLKSDWDEVGRAVQRVGSS